MASLYEMAQGPQAGFYDAYRQVKQDGQNDKMNAFKLADLQRADVARPMIGQALQGDAGAFDKLAGVDPSSYMDVGNYQRLQTKATIEADDATKAKVAGALFRADTPEKWAQTMDYLAKQGLPVDDEDRNFANRDAFLGQIQGVDGQLKQGNADRNYQLDQQNADTSRINATKLAQTEGPYGKAPAGFRWTQDGNLQPIKGGPQDPSRAVPNRTLRPTGDQSNAAGFYDRMKQAEETLADPAVTAAAIDYVGKTKANLPFGAGNYMASPDYQKFDQASRNFLNAVLRKESGAAISPSEFENGSIQYFPQPGDTPEKLALKAQNRATAINAMRRTAGPALQEGPQIQQPAAQQNYQGADGVTSADLASQDTLPADGGDQYDPQAIEMLASDPSPQMRAYFDETFGPGAAARVLGE